METVTAEAPEPVELGKPQKIERFGEEHFGFLLRGVLTGWRKAEVGVELGKCFRAERILPNGDALNLYVNIDQKEVALSHRPQRTGSWQNSIELRRVKTFELSGARVRFENGNQRYLIGSGGNWHYVTDKAGPREKRTFRVELQF